jgi:hypothetical protein
MKTFVMAVKSISLFFTNCLGTFFPAKYAIIPREIRLRSAKERIYVFT